MRSAAPKRRIALGRFLKAILAILGLVTLAVAWWPVSGLYRDLLAPTRETLSLIAVAELALALFIPARLPQVCLAALSVAAAFTVGFPFQQYLRYQRTPEVCEGKFIKEALNGGFRGLESSSIFHAYFPDYCVTYTFDNEGNRRMPTPQSADEDICVFGCSFTFGTGVSDHESWPALLAGDLWKPYRVHNYAMPAWGTADSHRILADRLSRHRNTTMVVYAWSAVHSSRNYLRASWWLGSRPNPDDVSPHYEIEDGNLVFKGFATPKQWLEDADVDPRIEEEISVALLKDMQRICTEHGCRFVVVRLDNNIGVEEDPVAESLIASGIETIDARPAVKLYFPHEKWHGTPEWHRAVADRIRDSLVMHTSKAEAVVRKESD